MMNPGQHGLASQAIVAHIGRVAPAPIDQIAILIHAASLIAAPNDAAAISTVIMDTLKRKASISLRVESENA
ncbi:hypothetical protein [Sphingomonas sp. IW22]|uniref:hypothetical protein n=1 Tax=Sphingomonas sp. IW22 TaxID=3242489 RepID=UPI003522232B